MASQASISVLQACMLLGGVMLLFVLGISLVDGGLTAIIGVGERARLICPVSDPEIPWMAILVLMFSTNIWYYCTSQNINQRALGAKKYLEWKDGNCVFRFLVVVVVVVVVVGTTCRCFPRYYRLQT